MNHIPTLMVPETAEERAERVAEQAWHDLRADCEAEFHDWVRAWRGSELRDNPREYVDFSDWLVGEARQFGGKYLEALDRVERQSLGKGRVGL